MNTSFKSFIIICQMKINTIALLIFVLLGLSTQQQGTSSKSTKVNFEGDFDSLNHINSTRQQRPKFTNDDLNDAEDEDSELEYAQEQKDMLEFSEHMADFLPDETFTFKLQPYQLEEFFLWPGAEVESVRGMFHSEVLDDNIDGHVSLALYDNDNLIRNYKQQRLGIFNIPHNLKDHRYTFKFQNSDSQLQVYFSYQFTTRQKRQSYQPKNETEIQRITREFQRVSRLVVQQESEMSRLVSISERHQQKIEDQLFSTILAMLFETILISFGTMLSLCLIKRQIYSGYELLV